MRLVPLEIGRIHADLMELVGSPGHARMPVPSWLVEHPRGLVLFDAGMHRELQRDTARIRVLFRTTTLDFHPGEELAARVTAAGYSPADVELLIFSHLHFDHCGGTAELPNARLVLQEPEWGAAHHPTLVELGVYNPDDFDVGHDRQLVDGVHDVFGDGRIVCLPTPGHTRGHQSLRVELDSGPVVLTGDCIYFSAMLDGMKVPAFGYDVDQQLESMRTLAGLRDQGCRLLFGHDETQFGSLPAGGLV